MRVGAKPAAVAGLSVALVAAGLGCRGAQPPSGTAAPAAAPSTVPDIEPTWTFDAGEPRVSRRRWQAPAVAGGGIVVVGGRSLFALGPDGAASWEYPDSFGMSAPLIDDAGLLWAGSSIGWVHRVDQGGQGQATVGGGHTVDHLALDHSGRVYAAGAKLLIVIRTDDGKPDGSHDAGVTSLAAGRSGVVWRVTRDHVQLSDEHGAFRWSQKVANCAPPAVDAAENVYLGCDVGLVSYAVDGRWRWTYPVAGAGGPSLDVEGRVYFGSRDGSVHAVAGHDGRRVWSWATGGAVKATPALAANGNVYVGNEQGRFVALAADGSPLGSFTAAAALYAPTIAPDGTVYVQSTAGVLHAFAERNGGLAGSPWPKLCADLGNTCRLALGW